MEFAPTIEWLGIAGVVLGNWVTLWRKLSAMEAQGREVRDTLARFEKMLLDQGARLSNLEGRVQERDLRLMTDKP